MGKKLSNNNIELLQIGLLEKSAKFNPYVAEPHVLLSQVHVQAGRWDAAQREAVTACKLMYQWCTAWDKRVELAGWIAWARCIHFQAGRKEWPTTSGGVESLGAVTDKQRYRDLSVGANFLRHAKSP